MNVKHIAATLAILGSASFSLAGCNKAKEGTEVPAADGGAKKEGSCGEKKDGSCGGDKAAAPAEGEGDAAAPAEPAAE
jgi:hypothetical protein